MASDPSEQTTSVALPLKNELAGSSSPYLRSHASSPVAFQEWNSETLSLARKSDRLIFLSIGYYACHWCHVMEHESFQSPEVAEILNASFIPIKVDRESRPDIDEIYMNYVTATTGSGGWPLNVFLTPNLQPVFGGTYWPGPGALSSRRRPSTTASDDVPMTFLDILQKMEDVWRTQRDRCIQSAADITRQLRDFAEEGTHSHSQGAVKGGPRDTPEPLELDLLDDALDHFISRYDTVHGGFSPAAPNSPKFPTPPNLAFLLRIGASITSTSTRFGFPSPVPPILGEQSCAKAATMALHTLMTISRSGLRDHLGHGFHRYSVTADWNLPHFEKMLYDNAQLLGCYCDAWALARDPEILGTIYSLVEYFTAPDSRIVDPAGGWYSGEDADSHPSKSTSTSSSPEPKKEGAFYVWTLKEIHSLLPNPTHATILAQHFGILTNGNVPPIHDVFDELLSQNVLHIASTPRLLAKELGLPEPEITQIIKSGRASMAAHRAQTRPAPGVDTKILTAWNALAISALVRAAHTLAPIDAERSDRCRFAAVNAAAFIRSEMYDEATGRLQRIHSPAGEHSPAFLDDYAYMTRAAHALYDLTFDDEYLSWAEKLQYYTDKHFWAEGGGGYFQAETSRDGSQGERIIALKPGTDTDLPSANGVVAQNLWYLGGIFLRGGGMGKKGEGDGGGVCG